VKALKWIPLALAALVVCWLTGDFIYSRIVLHRYQAWERSIERDTDGVRIGCRDFCVGEGRTALLFVHGYSDSPAMFRLLAPRLAELGFRCRVMLRPGCARPLDLYAEATREKWRNAVKREIALLGEKHERVFVVSHSLGSAIAIDYLLEEREMIDGIVLLAPLIELSRGPLVVLQLVAKAEEVPQAIDRLRAGVNPTRLTALVPALLIELQCLPRLI